eukprot:GFYU01007266.1.p1 GENE.GFYU01007266.1~~GFYU01007266.1.p1  ORF type:complete len:246 (-),score=29.02 GFYU01007266.1:32-736(-)
MGYMVTFGCLFTALSPAAALFFLVIAKQPYLVIVSIVSSFFWMLSIMVAALFWLIISPLQTTFGFVIPLSVLIQEGFRYLYLRVAYKAEAGFGMPGSANGMELNTFALASGVGYSIAHTFVMYGSIFFESSGPGTYHSTACPHISIFQSTSYIALCFSFFHLASMILAYDGYKRMHLPSIIVVILSHLSVALLSLANESYNGCATSLPLMFVLVLALIVYTIYLYRSNISLKRA